MKYINDLIEKLEQKNKLEKVKMFYWQKWEVKNAQ